MILAIQVFLYNLANYSWWASRIKCDTYIRGDDKFLFRDIDSWAYLSLGELRGRGGRRKS
jgi:hypothetical protein